MVVTPHKHRQEVHLEEAIRVVAFLATILLRVEELLDLTDKILSLSRILQVLECHLDPHLVKEAKVVACLAVVTIRHKVWVAKLAQDLMPEVVASLANKTSSRVNPLSVVA